MDRIFASFNGREGPGCAVGVYRDGLTVYARGYGMANLELGVPITPRTAFNIGSVWSTIEDMARWDRNWNVGTVGGRPLVDSLLVRGRLNDGSPIAYALGGSLDPFRGLPSYTKDGDALGYTATYRRFLDDNLGIAILCNVDAATDPLTLQVATVYLTTRLAAETPAKPDAWETALLAAPEVPRAVGQLRPYESWWRAMDQREMHSIRVEADRLLMNQGTRLVPIAGDRFRVSGAAAVELAFDADRTGRAQRLRIRNRNGTTTFERKDAVTLTAGQLAEYAGEYRSDEIETAYTLSPEGSGLVVRIGGRRIGVLEPTWRDAFLLTGTTVRPTILPRVSSIGDGIYVFEFTRDVRARVVAFAIQGRQSGAVRNLPFEKQP